MQELIYELINLLRRLPAPLKALGAALVFLPIVYIAARTMGLGNYAWVFMLGVVVIGLVVAGFMALVGRRDKAKGDAFQGELKKESERGAGASRGEVRQAQKELAQKWAEAADSLKQAGLSIYSLPWYLLIGEPQSGKSTTLKNSGLEFPLGGEALSGAGGTRNCDWWFANEAVILDTAGRFTFQEEAAPDQAEWSTFLKLLSRHRAHCPINGVLVVIPCTTLLEDSPEEQEKKATNIRNKLLHVQRVLEVRFPVFIMVTKADRVLGFSEFFTRLDPVEQRQLFGWSNPEGTDKAFDPNGFDATFENIVTRVHKLRLKFLSTEENTQNVDRFSVFPEELRALRDPLKRYLSQIFQTTRYDEPFLFRGYYVSSGVQQGKPIAQATRDLLKGPSGSSADVIESLENIFKKSRAFFIKDFYEKKVFPEQGLIARTRAALKKEKKTLWAVRIMTAVIILAVLLGMLPAWITLRTILNPINKHIGEADKCVNAKEKPCRVGQFYELASNLQRDRDEVQKHPFILAMFFQSAKSNELVGLLGTVQRKLLLDGVARPLLKESAARMSKLDWEKYYRDEKDYQAFFQALLSLLHYRGVEVASSIKDPELAFKVEDLRIGPFVEFCRRTSRTEKGAEYKVEGTDKAGEIAEWVASLAPGDPKPDAMLTGSLKGRTPDDVKGIAVDPTDGVKKFEDYWTVANLARWDYKLYKGLEEYVSLQNQLSVLQSADSKDYLKRYVTYVKGTPDGKTPSNLDAVWKRLDDHLKSPRPGVGGFPGTTLESWTKFFGESYDKLMRYKPAVPTQINEDRKASILGRLQGESANLDSTKASFSYLLVEDKEKLTWTKFASARHATVVEVGNYADLDAFAASDDGKLLPKIVQISDWTAKAKNLDDWRTKQLALRDAALKGVAEAAGASPPDKALWPQTKSVTEQAAALALIYRVLPTMQQFFAESLRTNCPPGLCYQANFAKMMMPIASGSVGFVESQQGAIGRPDVRALANGISEEQKGYVERFIDQMGGSFRGGGAGFIFPSAAAAAKSWPVFQGAIVTWTPAGSGGGAALPIDAASQLSMGDIQQFAASNGYLNPLIEYYRSRIEKPKAAKASAHANPELVAAAMAFKQTVQVLSDQPLKAWKQLVTGADGASLRAWHSFSQNPAVKNRPEARTLKIRVEDHGAGLMRDAIAPQFSQRVEPLWRRLNQCCTARFPFVTETQIRQERVKYSSVDTLQRTGGGMAQSYRLALPTISQADISGVMTDVGALADEFALDPILSGAEPTFDFVGGERRGMLRVAVGWERFLLGSAAIPKAGGPATTVGIHNVEVRAVERAITPPRRFMGDRVGQVALFDKSTILRPSTDVKSGRTPPPYVWKLATADAPVVVSGRNEQSSTGWTGSLEVTGGPLSLYYYIRLASEERREGQDERVWTIRVVIPDAEVPREPLEGAFELRFDEPLPPILH